MRNHEKSQTKEWMFNFSGGGWNTVWAASQEEAIEKVNKEFGYLNPLLHTIKKVEDNIEAYNIAMSNFW